MQKKTNSILVDFNGDRLNQLLKYIIQLQNFKQIVSGSSINRNID